MELRKGAGALQPASPATNPLGFAPDQERFARYSPPLAARPPPSPPPASTSQAPCAPSSVTLIIGCCPEWRWGGERSCSAEAAPSSKPRLRTSLLGLATRGRAAARATAATAAAESSCWQSGSVEIPGEHWQKDQQLSKQRGWPRPARGLRGSRPKRQMRGCSESGVAEPSWQKEGKGLPTGAMQHPLDLGAAAAAAHYFPADPFVDHRSHRYRSFMIEEILTDHPDAKSAAPAGELLKFGVKALLSTRPYHNPLAVLKAEQAAVFKFPLAPLGCSGLSSALLAAGSSLQGGSGSPHLPLELHLRGKLEPGTPEGGGKAKKGRRSRTVFTELQLMGLEKRFEKQKYLSTPDRIDLAESLGLSQLQVKTWYQNRRMKWKKIVLQGGGLESPTKPKGRPKKNSIPSSEQLTEQERAREAEKQHAENLDSPCQVIQE